MEILYEKVNRMVKGKIVSINCSFEKGVQKKPVEECTVVENFGIKNDAHGGEWHRQISLLAQESVDKMIALGLNVSPGAFGENITTEGIDLVKLPIGTRLKLGKEVLLEVTQIGKECHTRCAIYYQAGDCVMPHEGIFARVIHGGKLKTFDPIEVLIND